MDRLFRLSPHFRLGEMVPKDCTTIPDHVMDELTDLCRNLLEPIRKQFGPVVINSAYRDEVTNARIGGSPTSDHCLGKAADIRLTGNSLVTWEERTIEAYDWIIEHLAGKYGQAILEDHRKHTGASYKIWIHVATPSVKHPGEGDLNSRLVSYQPGIYEPYGRSEA